MKIIKQSVCKRTLSVMLAFFIILSTVFVSSSETVIALDDISGISSDNCSNSEKDDAQFGALPELEKKLPQISGDPSALESTTIYFKNTDNWDNVYCQALTDDQSTSNAPFPGIQMSYDAETKLYYTTLSSGYTYVIFSDGSYNQSGQIYMQTDTNNAIYDNYGYTYGQYNAVPEGDDWYVSNLGIGNNGTMYAETEAPSSAQSYKFTLTDTNIYTLDTGRTITDLKRVREGFYFCKADQEGNSFVSRYHASSNTTLNVGTNLQLTKTWSCGYEIEQTQINLSFGSTSIAFGHEDDTVRLVIDENGAAPVFYYELIAANLPSDDYTVYFQNRFGWENIYAYVYYENGDNTIDFSDAWFGDQITHIYNNNSFKIFDYTIQSIPTKYASSVYVVFNNGESGAANQRFPLSGDSLQLCNGRLYIPTDYNTVEINDNVDSYIENLENNMAQYTVYFENDQNWSDVYLYQYGGDSGSNGSFPGQKLDYTVDDFGLMKFSFRCDASYIVFSDGSTANKTAELRLANNRIYRSTTLANSNGEAYIAESDYYIVGSFKKKSYGSFYYSDDSHSAAFKFEKNTDHEYTFDTGCTVAELSGMKDGFSFDAVRGSRSIRYKTVDKLVPITQELMSQYGAVVPICISTNRELANGTAWFDDAGFTASGAVTIKLDPINNYFWYELNGLSLSPVGISVQSPDDKYRNVNISVPDTAYATSTVKVTVTDIPAGKTVDNVIVTPITGGSGAKAPNASAAFAPNAKAVGDNEPIYAENVGERGDHVYAFQMPENVDSVNIEVTFRNLTTFTVTTAEGSSPAGGEHDFSTITVAEGQGVTISTILDFKYDVQWNITKACRGESAVSPTDYSIDGSLNSPTFVIYPKTDLIITANYSQKYVSVDDDSVKLYKYTSPNDSGSGGIALPLYKNGSNEIFARIAVEDNDFSDRYFMSNSSVSGYPTAEDSQYDQYGVAAEYIGENSEKLRKLLQIETPYYGQYEYLRLVYQQENNSDISAVIIKIGYYDESGYVVLYSDTNSFGNSVRSYKLDAEWTLEIPEPAFDTTSMAKVYAKNATLHSDYEKYPDIGETTISYTDTLLSNAQISTASTMSASGFAELKEYDNYVTACVERNRELTITTRINDEYKGKYYVKAFCVNGSSYGIISSEEEAAARDGVFTATYTISDDDPIAIEITPVYYWFTGTDGASDFFTLKVDGFDGEVRQAWGNTIACRVYYENSFDESTPQNALGGDSGQPMIKLGGSCYIQIPKASDSLGAVKGVTLNNYCMDDIHGGKLIGVSGFNGLYSSTNDRDASVAQTYDYDDLSAINGLDNDYKVDNITFTFKYKSYNNNNGKFDGGSMGNVPYEFGSNVEGWNDEKAQWEVLTDYYGNPIDLFGNKITAEGLDTVSKVIAAYTSDKSSVNYVISDGYENYSAASAGTAVEDNYIGEYGTKWYVYSRSNDVFSCSGALPPSAFLPSFSIDDESSSYLSDDVWEQAKNKLSADHSSILTANGSAGTKPVMISYESALYSAGRQNASVKKGLRCDGRWTYSVRQAKVKADVRIQYFDSSIGGFDDDAFIANSNKGSVTGACVSFKNTSGVQDDAIKSGSVTSSETELFSFTADPISISGDKTYVFLGWYRKDVYGDLVEITDEFDGTALMDGNYSFIARYVSADSFGTRTLVVSHRQYTDNVKSSLFGANIPTVQKGSGETAVSVSVLSGDRKIYTYKVSSKPITVDSIYLQGNYTIRIDLFEAPDKFSYYFGDSTYYVKDNAIADDVTGRFDITDPTYKSVTINGDDVNAMFTGDNSMVSRTYYTSFNLNTITVKYKYFDRNTDANSEITIKDEATELAVDVPYTSTDEFVSRIIAYGMGQQLSVGDSVSTIENLLDRYYLWTSQNKAVDGIKELPDYRSDNTGVKKYGDENASVALADLQYHMDNVGRTDTNDRKHWVYYGNDTNSFVGDVICSVDSNDNIIGGTTVADVIGSDGSNSSQNSVTVWAYNAPRMYNVTLVYPKAYMEGASIDENAIATAEDSKVNLVTSVDGDNNGDSNMPADVFYVQPSSAGDGGAYGFTTVVPSIYGQRFGVANAASGADSPGVHAAEYGFDLGYNGKTIIAAQSVLHDVNGYDERFVFDGWYDYYTGAKITSEIEYSYRVNGDITLVAGYKMNTSNQTLGLSATGLVSDKYVTSNYGELVERTRLNTELSVYNAVTNIDQIAVVYGIYRVQGVNSLYNTEYAASLVDYESSAVLELLNSDKTTAMLKNDDNASVAQLRKYTYSNDNNSNGASLSLNNKGRALFTYDVDSSLAQTNGSRSVIVAYAAIRYTPHGKALPEWKLSENAVVYIEGEPVGTANSVSNGYKSIAASASASAYDELPFFSLADNADGESDLESDLDDLIVISADDNSIDW